MSTGTPTIFKFLKEEHPIGEVDCFQCWDFEALLCKEPRCQGLIHNEIEDFYTNEQGDLVWAIATCCDSCGRRDKYEWVDVLEPDEEEDDDDEDD